VLTQNNVPHVWWMFGRPGPGAPFGCDGGHNFGCWNFAFNDALPRMLTVLAAPSVPPPPPGANVVGNGGFESGLGGWECLGTCGADVGAGLARNGVGNGWARGTGGWNDLHQTIPVVAHRTYQVRGFVRTSASAVDGFIGLRNAAGQVLAERRFSALDGYTQLDVTVNAGNHTNLVFFAGVWASGDTWLQLDDVSVVGI
jgi:hypothetical protein